MPDFGPLPALPFPEEGDLPPARKRVLAALRGLDRPADLTELAAAAELHPNTVREHVEALLADGNVRRHRAAPRGRGRPAWLYEPVRTAPGLPGLGAAEYVGLVTSLAEVISETSTDPRAAAIKAGAGWGRVLAARMSQPAGPDADAAREQVVALLADLGFAPEVDPENDPHTTSVRLTRCPLLEAARVHPDVVCGVHLGIARAALQTWRAPTEGTGLTPFSDPGFCRLRLAPGPRGEGSPSAAD